MSLLLLDWIASRDVGNVAEALIVARSFVGATPDLELHLLLNATTAVELAHASRDVATVYAVDVDSHPEACLAAVPLAWDYVVHRPRAASEGAEQLLLLELVTRRFEGRRWQGALGAGIPTECGLHYNPGIRFELELSRVSPFESPLGRHRGTKIALGVGDWLRDGSRASLDFWCRLAFALRAAFPDATLAVVGLSDCSVPGIAASAQARDQLRPLFATVPDLIDGYDLGLWPTLGLLRDCDVLIAAPNGLSRLASCVGTRRLVLTSDPCAEHVDNQVPFASVDCGSGRTLGALIFDVIGGVALLRDPHFDYQAALAKEHVRPKHRQGSVSEPLPPPAATSTTQGAGANPGAPLRRLNVVPSDVNAASRPETPGPGMTGGADSLPHFGRRDLFCAKPFQHFEIQHDGRAYLCCPAWMPEPLGSVTRDKPLALWNGWAAQRIRSSILDGSFRYCTGCPFLSSVTGPVRRRSELTDDAELSIIRDARLLVARIGVLNLAYDRSCNLSCPTCRTEVIVASGPRLDGLRTFQDALVTPELLRSLDCLYVTGSGDPFASAALRDLLRSLDADDYPNLAIALHTNALLFTEENWERMRRAQPLVSSVEISIDAATAATYALNRRGGDWNRLLERLEFVRTLRDSGAVPYLKLSFVVQENNWREMAAFVRLARRFGADATQFTALANWGTFGPAEFARRAVHLPSHPEHAEFMCALMEEVDLQDPLVMRNDLMDASA